VDRRQTGSIVAVLAACNAVPTPAAPLPANRQLPARTEATLRAPAPTPMHFPTDVVVDRDGTILVAGGANDRIVRFTPDGRFDGLLAFTGDAPLRNPLGLWLDHQRRLWITQGGHDELVVARLDGTVVERFRVPPAADAPADPTDVCVTGDGRKTYIVDNDHHRILMRDNTSKTFTVLGEPGWALGQMQWPFMITVDAKNFVYISEAVGARVQRLNPRDQWLTQIARWGVELGQLYRPKGLTLDAKRRVFVSDSTLGVVQVFNERGRTLAVLTEPGGALLRFHNPMGLAFDPTGRLLVVETGKHQVVVLELLAEAEERSIRVRSLREKQP
jgi:tripartite motif-containing protein 71